MTVQFGDARLPPRFWRKVDVDSRGCWVWTAGKFTNGYGSFSIAGGTVLTRRLAYSTLIGDIPEGLQLDHLCRVRHCLNPEHLEPVTCRENLMRGDTLAADHAARTHCPNGHPLAEGNLVPAVARRHGRGCQTCARERSAERNALIRRAVQASGLTHANYLAEYGSSRASALSVIRMAQPSAA